MDCGLFGVRFLFLGHKNGTVAPVDYSSTFATAPFYKKDRKMGNNFIISEKVMRKNVTKILQNKI